MSELESASYIQYMYPANLVEDDDRQFPPNRSILKKYWSKNEYIVILTCKFRVGPKPPDALHVKSCSRE